MRDALQIFLLAFPALFSIVNPLGGGFMFLNITRRLSHDDREWLALWIAIYSLILLNASIYIGAYVLSFLGISLPALRIAGGLVIALMAWRLLDAADDVGPETDANALRKDNIESAAFYPLTMPLTTGPGSISVAVALGTSRPVELDRFVGFALGATLAVALVVALVYVTYRWCDRLSELIGRTGTAIILRLSAFLLFCIGIEVLTVGLAGWLAPLLAR
ncbi:MAG TPA: MarC family protein [Alphaproteobacteria bacterium]|nr:MarC family protein [Alphaproteobacteria bacterium]